LKRFGEGLPKLPKKNEKKSFYFGKRVKLFELIEQFRQQEGQIIWPSCFTHSSSAQ
jgi:hypothetical protein